jgi:cell division protein FtsB
MPFIFLVVGLLGGGLVCLLVLNTILASGAFQLTSLQQSNTNLAQRAETLQQQIAQEESPGVIAAEARELGMVPVRQPHFINLKTGRIYGTSATPGPGR